MDAKSDLKNSIIRKLTNAFFSGPAGSIFRGMATIAFGSMIGRIISILVIPLLSRLYGPESFGILAIFISTVAFLLPLTTMQYMVAVPLPKTDAMAINVLVLAASLAVGTTLLLAIVFSLVGPELLASLGMAGLAPYGWLISLGVLWSVTYELLSIWATRKRDYKIISRTSVIQSISGALTKLGLGLLSPAPAGLVLGQIVSQSGGVVSLAKRFWGDLKGNLRKVRFKRILLAARLYNSFPVYRLPSQYVLIFSQQAPILFVASFYGVAVAGQLAIARMLVTLPVNMLSWSLTKAAYGEIARIKDNNPGQIKQILKSVVGKLFLVSSTVSVAIFFLAPPLLPMILGNEWQDAGIFASYLAIHVVANIIAIPMTAFINIFDRQREYLAWNLVRATLLGGLIGCAVYFDLSAYSFILLFGLAMLVFEAGIIARTGRIVDLEVGNQQNAPHQHVPAES